MTNLSKNTVIKEPLSKIVVKKGNPHRGLWQDFLVGKVSNDELHRILRGKLLKSVYKMNKQPYPFKPTLSKNKEKNRISMQGWGEACNEVDCANAGNKWWLGILLKDIAEGKLEAEQGKEEEIEELLSEWY